MKDLIKLKKRSSKIYFRTIESTNDLTVFKAITEPYRKYRRVFLVHDYLLNTTTGKETLYSYLEVRTFKKIYRYISFTIPHFEEL